jgi:hypothetical protein
MALSVIHAKQPPGTPPAVWAAFARAAGWKNWVLCFQFVVIALLLLANMRLVRKEPDIVLITPDGKSSYVERDVAQAALLQFLAEQKGQPSTVTVLHFAREFLTFAQAVNSSTFEQAWVEALSLMSPGLRERFQKATDAQKLVEAHQAMQVRTELSFEEVKVVEQTSNLFHVRAIAARSKSNLVDGSGASSDRLSSDLVLRVVPRTQQRPDGLEVVEWRLKALTAEGPNTPAPEGKHDAP